MLIRSQDKRSIVNLNNVAEISILNDYEICAFHGQGYVDLGTYSTEEKAIKVLDMICDDYNIPIVDAVVGTYERNIHMNHIFQMPQDEEVEV